MILIEASEAEARMMSYDNFSEKIQKVIDECSYPFFIVQQDFNKLCTCISEGTSQSDPACRKCLGTGYKVKIKIAKGASYEEMKIGGASISVKNSRIIKHYYIKPEYKIFQDNYIIDNNEVYYVYRVTAKRGIRNEYTHQEIIASLHVNDHDIILNNCLAVIKKNLPKNRWEEFPWLQK